MDPLEQAANAHRAGDFEAAERGYLALPDRYEAVHNLGVLYVAQARFPEAEAAFRRALALKPDAGASAFSLAMQLLARGDYVEGLRLYEGRRYGSGYRIPSLDDLMPEWRGEDLTGKNLVVVGEQGFGDQIMFARFLPRTAAKAVAYICSPSVLPLFQGCPFGLAPGVAGHPPPRGDYWTLVGSLPLRLGLRSPDALPPPLHLPWARRTGGGGIGVMVRGNPRHANDANRSLPASIAGALLALGRDLSPDATGARHFRDTADIILGLDLVITVDTSVAHLAGTLGVPTWILLPARGADWRWLRERADSPWYPSVRLFRQPAPGAWDAVLADIRTALAAAP